jgi:cytochrome c oxidase cbb3-type subunit 1
MQSNAQLEYDYSIVKAFTFTTILFGIIGMTVGVILAFQLAFPELSNLAGEYGTFSRLRPIHTNGVTFGFTLSGIFATWYYVGQRTLTMSLKNQNFLQ